MQDEERGTKLGTLAGDLKVARRSLGEAREQLQACAAQVRQLTLELAEERGRALAAELEFKRQGAELAAVAALLDKSGVPRWLPGKRTRDYTVEERVKFTVGQADRMYARIRKLEAEAAAAAAREATGLVDVLGAPLIRSKA